MMQAWGLEAETVLMDEFYIGWSRVKLGDGDEEEDERDWKVVEETVSM